MIDNSGNVIGFWSFTPLFIVVLSAVVISYQWAGNLIYRVVGENPPQQRGPGNAAPQRGGTERSDAAAPLDNLDGMWARAARQVPGWRSLRR